MWWLPLQVLTCEKGCGREIPLLRPGEAELERGVSAFRSGWRCAGWDVFRRWSDLTVRLGVARTAATMLGGASRFLADSGAFSNCFGRARPPVMELKTGILGIFSVRRHVTAHSSVEDLDTKKGLSAA